MKFREMVRFLVEDVKKSWTRFAGFGKFNREGFQEGFRLEIIR